MAQSLAATGLRGRLKEEGGDGSTALARVFVVLGVMLVVLGVLFDPGLVERLHFRRPLSAEALEETGRARLGFWIGGLLLSAFGVLVRRERSPRIRLGPGGVRWTIGLLCSALPLFVLDRAARPFVERLTSLYVADPELGWKHRPGAEDSYWGERVKINAQGMRGPERTPPRTPGVQRVLVLGDSVVFGLGLADDGDTLPARLEGELRERGARPFECLDAAVCGWSPWQYLRFLELEGEKWQADLVVLGFVLNDVTERFGLQGSGGAGRGAQLTSARSDLQPGWLAESGLYLALRELRVWYALRRDSTLARAHANRLTPYHLILQPETERVRQAWALTLPELEAIHSWCRTRAIPLLLVVFPYALQLAQPGADAPQQVLADFARRGDIVSLDLLPPLVRVLREQGLEPSALFFDGLHPTALGNRKMAAEIAPRALELLQRR